MIAEGFAVIGRVDEQGFFSQPESFELGDDATDLLVEGRTETIVRAARSAERFRVEFASLKVIPELLEDRMVIGRGIIDRELVDVVVAIVVL